MLEFDYVTPIRPSPRTSQRTMTSENAFHDFMRMLKGCKIPEGDKLAAVRVNAHHLFLSAFQFGEVLLLFSGLEGEGREKGILSKAQKRSRKLFSLAGEKIQRASALPSMFGAVGMKPGGRRANPAPMGMRNDPALDRQFGKANSTKSEVSFGVVKSQESMKSNRPAGLTGRESKALAGAEAEAAKLAASGGGSADLFRHGVDTHRVEAFHLLFSACFEHPTVCSEKFLYDEGEFLSKMEARALWHRLGRARTFDPLLYDVSVSNLG